LWIECPGSSHLPYPILRAAKAISMQQQPS
jgi:hypothetical protein